jgi:cullin-associated NEDD8-dissociated protein 1
MELLFNNTDKEEEGIRTVVAKCMGKFAMIAPEQIMPALQRRLTDTSAHTRYTVVTAIKFAIDPHPHPVDPSIAGVTGQVLALLADPDVEVRRAVLLTLNYVAHNKPSFVRPVLAEHLNALFEETKVKKELIKVVDLGPFKHKVDEGLENRKAAFECLYTLLDTCIDKLDIGALTSHLVSGLGDIHDIQLLCHLILIRIAQHAPAPLLTGLDQLIEPLKKTINTKVNQTAVKQQIDRNEELIRSALRAIAAVSRIPDIDSNVKFEEFLKQTVRTSSYAEQFENILKETAPKAAATAE